VPLSPSPLRVQILTAELSRLDEGAFLTTVRKLEPQLSGTRESRGFVLKFSDGLSGRLSIGDVSPIELADDEALEAAVEQTWDWPNLDHALQHTRGALTLTEIDATGDRLVRIQRMSVVVRSLLEHVKPVAIHWVTAQRLVEPQGFIASLAHGAGPVDYALNVRLFRIPNGKQGELVMDTLGLGPFALPDLQVHFAGADPRAMGEVLAGYAEYLFAKGDVLTDDSLVRGIQTHEEWPCHREESLILPAREVVDLLPDDIKVAH
jgi:hypothetical protein